MLYLLVLLLTGSVSVLADKRRSQLAVLWVVILLSAFCGLRGASVGVDTSNYYNLLSNIRITGVRYGSDIGFSAVSYVLMKLLGKPEYVLLTYAFFTNCLIVFRLWDFRDKASFPLMILIFMVFHYPYTFNIVRHYLAIAVIFWGTRYLERNCYFRYIVLNAIAVGFHTSAILCFSFLFLSFGFRCQTKKFKTIGFILAFFFVVLGVVIFNSNIQKYSYYFLQSSGTIHGMTLLKTLCMLGVVFTNKVLWNRKLSMSRTGEYVPMGKEVVVAYLTGLVLASTGMFYTYMNRVGFYFLMYEMPFWGQIVRVRKNAAFYRLVVAVMVLYAVIQTVRYDTSGLINYVSFLQGS